MRLVWTINENGEINKIDEKDFSVYKANEEAREKYGFPDYREVKKYLTK